MTQKKVVFSFPPQLAEVAKQIIDKHLVAQAIAKCKDQIGECSGYEVRLSKNQATGEYDLDVYPLFH
jgi:hypothetical protein